MMHSKTDNRVPQRQALLFFSLLSSDNMDTEISNNSFHFMFCSRHISYHCFGSTELKLSTQPSHPGSLVQSAADHHVEASSKSIRRVVYVCKFADLQKVFHLLANRSFNPTTAASIQIIILKNIASLCSKKFVQGPSKIIMASRNAKNS